MFSVSNKQELAENTSESQPSPVWCKNYARRGNRLTSFNQRCLPSDFECFCLLFIVSLLLLLSAVTRLCAKLGSIFLQGKVRNSSIVQKTAHKPTQITDSGCFQ